MTEMASPNARPPAIAPAALPQAAPRVFSVGQSPGDRALDQWRGLALLLVLASHGFFFTGRVPGIGRAGVNLFFFISGILVYRSLTRGPTGWLAGSRYFWFRRIKRLIPAKYFYLAAMVLLVLLIAPPVFQHSLFRNLPSSLLYYHNYFLVSDEGSGENLTGHLWSLACEMQFYLLAPLIFFAGGRSPLRRAAVWGGILLVLLSGGISVINKSTDTYNAYTFQVAVWPMMAGFFAEFLRELFPRRAAALAPGLVWAGALSFLALGPAMLLARKTPVILAGTLLVAGCLGCYIRGLAPRNRIGDALHFLGNRTYSIYLWQQPLTIGGFLPTFWHPFGSLLAIPFGALSFRFLEQPFMSKYQKPTAKVG